MPQPPAPTHIAVIGAGVIGASLAYRMVGAGPGVGVTLLDRDVPGRGASRWSLAWVNSHGVGDRGYHALRTASLRAWARLAGEVEGARWYRPVGNIHWPAPAQTVSSADYPAHLVGPDRVAALEPALRLPDGVREVAWYPQEGYVLTEPLITALLDRVRAGGGELRTGETGRVTALERAEGGGWTIRTAAGAPVRADAVVCCAGRWTPEVSGCAGTPVPIVDPGARGSEAPALVVRVGPAATPLTRIVHTPHVHLRPHDTDASGTVHLEAEDAHVDLHTPDRELDRWADTLLDRARAVMPGLARARVLERRVCVRPLPLDGLPLAGPAGASASGPYVVVTHSGVTLAPRLADLVSAELLTGRPQPELEPYRPRPSRLLP
ncbi:FAD-binding oxidoreductase [Streptomyces sp. ODS28]|uniref:NAD(P)/FAD-dependent oxidoreductase n=1 Tax=Streptomyces sp. ODS28 TaxID=3136688 RepID=UPI0031F0D396